MSRFVTNDTPGWVRALSGLSATGHGIAEYHRGQAQDARAERGLALQERAGQRADEASQRALEREQQAFIEDQQDRELRRSQAKAELEWDRFRFDTQRRVAPRITGAGSLMAATAGAALEQEHVRRSLETLPPGRRQEAIDYLAQQQQQRQTEKEKRQLMGEIQAAMEPPPGIEPWLSPEQGQQMIEDLADVNRPDIGPQQIRQVLEKQRAFVRNLRVARSTFAANHAMAQQLANSPEPPPELGISRGEWLARRRQAKTILEGWATDWGAFDPDEKYKEVMDVLRSTPRNDPTEVRQSVLRQLADDPTYQLLETPEERAQYRDEMVRWVLGQGQDSEPAGPDVQLPFEGDGQGFQGYSTQFESELGPDLVKELEQAAGNAKTQEDGDAAVVKILERENISPESVPPELGARLAQRVGTAITARLPPRSSAEREQIRQGQSTTRGPTEQDYQRPAPKGGRFDFLSKLLDDQQGASPEARAQGVARGNSQAAMPSAAVGRGPVGAGAAAAVMAAAKGVEAGGKITKRARGAGTWSQLSEMERGVLTRLLQRDPKRARLELERRGIDPATVPQGLTKKR